MVVMIDVPEDVGAVSWLVGNAVLGIGLSMAPGSRYRLRIHFLCEWRAAMEPTSCRVLA